MLLHGIMGSSVSWFHHVGVLAASSTVYAVDSIGEPGLSVQTAPITGAWECAEWLDEVLAGLGHGKVHLVGISRGGWLALNLAARSSERIASVTVFEPVGFEKLSLLRFLVWSLGVLPVMFAPAWSLRRFSAWTPEIRDTLRPLLFAGQGYRMRLPGQDLLSDDELRAVRVPVRIYLGERSSVHHSESVRERLRAVMPGARVEVVPRATHSLSLERADLVNEAILAAAR